MRDPSRSTGLAVYRSPTGVRSVRPADPYMDKPFSFFIHDNDLWVIGRTRIGNNIQGKYSNVYRMVDGVWTQKTDNSCGGIQDPYNQYWVGAHAYDGTIYSYSYFTQPLRPRANSSTDGVTWTFTDDAFGPYVCLPMWNGCVVGTKNVFATAGTTASPKADVLYVRYGEINSSSATYTYNGIVWSNSITSTDSVTKIKAQCQHDGYHYVWIQSAQLPAPNTWRQILVRGAYPFEEYETVGELDCGVNHTIVSAVSFNDVLYSFSNVDMYSGLEIANTYNTKRSVYNGKHLVYNDALFQLGEGPRLYVIDADNGTRIWINNVWEPE